MSITKKLVGALAAAAIAVLVTGCQIDTTTPMMVSQIRAVADTGAPSSVIASVTAVFATKDWCQDEGVMAAEVRNEAEQRDVKLAAAAIMAAQLATLVGPPPAQRGKVEAAGA